MDGFENYMAHHEIYVLTLLIVFVMTGKTSVAKLPAVMQPFVAQGLNPNTSLRYQDLKELVEAFKTMAAQLS